MVVWQNFDLNNLSHGCTCSVLGRLVGGGGGGAPCLVAIFILFNIFSWGIGSWVHLSWWHFVLGAFCVKGIFLGGGGRGHYFCPWGYFALGGILSWV